MTRIILDTNIISEAMRENPDKNFRDWYLDQHLDQLYLTSITIAELWQGVAFLDDAHPKRLRYRTLIEAVELEYEGRILPFDTPAAKIWGMVRGKQKRGGSIYPDLDSQIAAIAMHHDMAVATANIDDFKGFGIDLVNPLAPTKEKQT